MWCCCRHCSSGSVDGKRQPFGLESDLNVRTLSLDSRRQGSMVLARVMRQLSRSSTSKRGTPFSTADKDKEASKVRQAFGVLRLKMASVAVGQHECVVVFLRLLSPRRKVRPLPRQALSNAVVWVLLITQLYYGSDALIAPDPSRSGPGPSMSPRYGVKRVHTVTS